MMAFNFQSTPAPLTSSPFTHLLLSPLTTGEPAGPRHSGLFVSGERPLWLFASRGGLVSHPMATEGAVAAMTPFHNHGCQLVSGWAVRRLGSCLGLDEASVTVCDINLLFPRVSYFLARHPHLGASRCANCLQGRGQTQAGSRRAFRYGELLVWMGYMLLSLIDTISLLFSPMYC